MVDVLFIDGDHTYEGVKKDFELYSSLVKVGGIIAFHDIYPGPAKDNVGVLEFWSECRKHFNYKEIIKDFQQGSHGIGVIFMQ